MGILTVICWGVGLLGVGIVALFLFAWLRMTQHKNYFKRRGVTFFDGGGLGRFWKLISGQMSIADMELLMYQDVKETGKGIVGFSDSLSAPAYYVMDLDLVKVICVKEFEHFVNRRKITTDKNDLFLKRMLVSLEDTHWKGLRSKLSPAFTTGKIKKMVEIFGRSGDRMCEYLRNRCVGWGGAEVDVCEVYSKLTMDVIASCAFGIDSKTFESGGRPGGLSEFEEMAQRMHLKFDPMMIFKLMFVMIAPKVADSLGVQPFDLSPQKYFLKVVTDVMKQRREKGERQDDFLQLMMDAQQGLLKEDKESLEVMTGGVEESKLEGQGESNKFTIEDEDIVANCVMFLNAGFDTTKSLLTYAAYQMAVDQEVQQKLLEVVRQAVEGTGGKLTYDSVTQMAYMDMFLNETLRMYAPAARTERKCTKDFKIPGTNVVIEKGTNVAFPIMAVHRDPKYYENPDKFEPERWSPERKRERHPYAFAAFGHGPRNCIGMRFAMIEAKIALAKLILNFKLEPTAKTDIPPKFGNNIILRPINGMHLKITPRSASEE